MVATVVAFASKCPGITPTLVTAAVLHTAENDSAKKKSYSARSNKLGRVPTLYSFFFEKNATLLLELGKIEVNVNFVWLVGTFNFCFDRAGFTHSFQVDTSTTNEAWV